MKSATRTKISVTLIMMFLGLFTICELKASTFAGRKGVPTSGYTEIAPGQFMQSRNQVAFHSAQGGYSTRVTIKPGRSKSYSRKKMSTKEKLQERMRLKKAAIKARAKKSSKNSSTRMRLTGQSSLR